MVYSCSDVSAGSTPLTRVKKRGYGRPVVRFVLGALALLGVLTALFFELYGVPHFPFALMLGVSVGLGLVLAGYHSLLRLFGR
jgi:hypothetical protein